MTADKPIIPEEQEIDYKGRPFGYVDPENETAMVCEQDPVMRNKIDSKVKNIGIEVVNPSTFQEALRYMRFHIFDLIIIDEDFDTGIWEVNNVLRFLEGLSMIVRRQSYVVLISNIYTTGDNLHAYSKSVNLIINKSELEESELILRRALAEHKDFYHVFKDYVRKYGKI
jgi:CheY-like chemotaxis protein